MADLSEKLDLAARWLANAEGILITAGAGMGVDSGLPDFRGVTGLWREYPALKEAGLSFEKIANPQAFDDDPRLAWGFYGHRLATYRSIEPHAGFHILKKWGARMPSGSAVFTSNVDGHFQKAGFDEQLIVECHGTINYMQCVDLCTHDIWPATDFEPEVDRSACSLTNALPRCRNCGALARPNILMFDDWAWSQARTERQRSYVNNWLARVRNPVLIELGAGKAVPTVRNFGARQACKMIRINVRESAIHPARGVGLEGTALDMLTQLDEQVQALRVAGNA